MQKRPRADPAWRRFLSLFGGVTSKQGRGAWLTQWSVACGARSFSGRRDFWPAALQDRKARTGPVSTSVLCNKVGQVGGRYRDHRPVQMSKYSGLRRLRPARRPCCPESLHRSIDIPSALAETRENLVPLDDEIWRYDTRWRIRILRTADTWLMAPPAENRLAAQKVDEGPKIFFTVCARGRRGHTPAVAGNEGRDSPGSVSTGGETSVSAKPSSRRHFEVSGLKRHARLENDMISSCGLVPTCDELRC